MTNPNPVFLTLIGDNDPMFLTVENEKALVDLFRCSKSVMAIGTRTQRQQDALKSARGSLYITTEVGQDKSACFKITSYGPKVNRLRNVAGYVPLQGAQSDDLAVQWGYTEDDLDRIRMILREYDQSVVLYQDATDGTQQKGRDQLLARVEKTLREVQSPTDPMTTQRRVDAFRKAREAFMSAHKPLTSKDVAELMGSQATSNVHKMASDKRKRGEIFGMKVGAQYLYPVEQFNHNNGEPYSVMPRLIEMFDAKENGWRLAFWLVQGHTVLDGSTPAEALAQFNTSGVLRAAETTLQLDRV